MNNFWSGDSIGARWLVGIMIPVTMIVFYAVINGFTVMRNGAIDGTEAKKKVEMCIPMIDSLCNVIQDGKRDSEVFFEKQAIRDSFMIEQVKRIEWKLDRIEMK